MNKQVGSGLEVTAFAEGEEARRVQAFRSRSGIYAFDALPNFSEQHPLVVEVHDREGRFLPAALPLSSLPEDGLFPPNASADPPNGSADGIGPSGFHLFSAPTRGTPPGFAALRADLTDDGDEKKPASHGVAVVKPSRGGKWFGVADEEGRVAVVFPWPPFPDSLSGGLGGLQWDLDLEVRYEPQSLAPIPGARLPGYKDIFRQSNAQIVNGTGSGSTTWAVTLPYGEPLVLRTQGRSDVLVRPPS